MTELLIPNQDKILCKKIIQKPREVTDGGILLGRMEEIQPMVEIVSIGDKVESNLKTGDRCLVSSHAGQPMKYKDSSYFIMSPSEVLCVIRNDK